MVSLLLTSLLIAVRVVVGYDVRIHNAKELIRFSNHVNNGVFYRGISVYLEEDIVFNESTSQEFTPIGTDSTNYFPGTFDGQGHMISGLAVNTSWEYAGLFGYSSGLAIKNVVADSFSVLGTKGPNDVYVGGIIGQCYSSDNPCIIENNVLLGSVTYDIGTFNNTVYIGGIAGELQGHGFGSFLRNCATYGSVMHKGHSKHSYIGGIIGSASDNVAINNCINYGSVTRNGITQIVHIGGIVGESDSSRVENCVCTGSVDSEKTLNHIGSIAGYSTNTKVSYCYWSEDIPHEAVGRTHKTDKIIGSGSFDEEFYTNETITIGRYEGSFILDALNAYTDYHIQHEYSRWALNKDNRSITFTINGENTLTLNSQVILLPSLRNNGAVWFDGWYTDEECTVQLKNFEITADMDLYSMFRENWDKTYTITFDTNGGSPYIKPVTAQYLEVIELPRDITKEKYEFLCWETEDGEQASWNFTVQPYNITLYARFAPIHISSAEGLIAFSDLINNDISDYDGKTVYLDADIEFTDELSDKFRVIGESISSGHFIGTFDGQGHVISGLTISSDSNYAGLFGYSTGHTVKNTVIDDSCNMTFGDEAISPYTGSFVGYCSAKDKDCDITDCVNMMDIEFTMGNSNSFQLGGIVGYLESDYHNAHVNNCVNYGTLRVLVTHSYSYVYVGGILGEGRYCGWRCAPPVVANCVNYGNIHVNGAYRTRYIYASGIVGNEKAGIINCTNNGTIYVAPESGASGKPVWSILGMLLLALFVL